MYLGGYLEGRMTQKDISTFLSNLEYNYSAKDATKLKSLNAIKSFFREVDENMMKKLSSFDDLSTIDKEYYFKIYLFYAQIKGLLRGVTKQIQIMNDSNKFPKYKQLKMEDLLIIQADGEIPELLRYFSYKLNGRVYKLGEKNYFRKVFNIEDENPENILKQLMWKSRCSAMIKIIHDKNGKIVDLLSGHTTWSDYSELYRTMKQ